MLTGTLFQTGPQIVTMSLDELDFVLILDLSTCITFMAGNVKVLTIGVYELAEIQLHGCGCKILYTVQRFTRC